MACGVTSEYLKVASPVIADSLASLFTAILCHGYMSKCLRDCVIIPIPKDASLADNYRPIALASSLRKILERIVLAQYSSYLLSSPLQFGFKAGMSTSLCTGVVKNVISRSEIQC